MVCFAAFRQEQTGGDDEQQQEGCCCDQPFPGGPGWFFLMASEEVDLRIGMFFFLTHLFSVVYGACLLTYFQVLSVLLWKPTVRICSGNGCRTGSVVVWVYGSDGYIHC